MTRFRLCVLAGIIVAAAACSTADGAGWAGTLRDSAGIQIVENPASGTWTDASRWTLRETLRIGTAEGEPEYQFGNITPLVGVTADPAGAIFVLDQQGQHVKVFDAAGQWLRTIGRPGNGPGEIAPGASGVYLGRGDTLMVYDAGNARFNRYLADGTFVSSSPIDFSKGIPVVIRPTGDGRMVAQFRQFPFPGVAQVDSMDHIVLLNADGSVADTVSSFPSGTTFTAGRGGQPAVRLFAPEPSWEYMAGGGMLFGINNAFRIEVRGPDGALQRVITKVAPPVPVVDADRTAIRDAMARLIRQNAPQVTAEQVAAFVDNIEFADQFPAFYILVAGPQETVWAQRVQVPSQLPEDQRANYNPQQDIGSPIWDVFDRAGRYLGELTMPGRAQPMYFVGTTLYALARDEFDVQYVVRLELEGLTE